MTNETPRPRLHVGSRVCQCAACAEFFSSPTAFDAHRTGPQDARRCLSSVEMLAAGMLKNARGFWVASAYDRVVVA